MMFKSRMKHKFKRFCYGTSIHGFLDLYTAKQLFWTSFWFIILVAAFGMTVYQVSKATNQFIYQTTSTKLETVTKDDLLYPPLKVCFCHWMYWIDWEQASSKNFTKESLLYAMSYLGNVYSSKKFDENKARLEFFEIARKNNFTKFSPLIKAIEIKSPFVDNENESKIFTSELYYGNDWYLLNCYTVPGEQIVKHIYGNEWPSKLIQSYTATQSVFKFSIADVSFETVKKFLTLHEYGYYIADWHDRFIENFKNFENVTLPWLIMPNGYNPGDASVIQYDYDYVEVKIVGSVKKWKQTSSYRCTNKFKMIKPNNSCIDRCVSQYNFDTTVCPVLTETISIDEDYFENLCPFNIYMLDENDSRPELNWPYRKRDEFFDNQVNKVTLSKAQNELENCLNQCDRSCEMWSYTYVSSFTNYGADVALIKQNYTNVYIYYPTPDDIIMMTQMETQTWEDYVANVGGLLGVWTGASLLSIVQLIYLCFCAQDSKSPSRGSTQETTTSMSDITTVDYFKKW